MFFDSPNRIRQSLSPFTRHSTVSHHENVRSESTYLSDYYTLRHYDHPHKKPKKNKIKKHSKTLSVASLQDHNNAIQKLHITLDNRNKHLSGLIQETNQLKNQNKLLRMSIEKPRNNK